MSINNSIISEDCFFRLFFMHLFEADIIPVECCILDVETSDYSQIKKISLSAKKVFAFISNDIDYYALKHFSNIIFIDRRVQLNEVLACIISNNGKFNYRINKKLTIREYGVMLCLLRGYNVYDSSLLLNITIKAFYASRSRLIKKFDFVDRNKLYSTIARYKN